MSGPGSIAKAAALAALLALGAPAAIPAAENPRDRLDYWRSNFDLLTPEKDPRAARAHAIFRRVLAAAGKRPGVVPRLLVLDSASPYAPLAFAIPDGGIVISRKVLDICYGDPARGDDRLAFVLGHEIAHQLKDDFWHMKFFQAIEISRGKDAGGGEVLDEVRGIARSTENVLSKELQADEHGIVYASMAGFDTSAVVTEDGRVNFFAAFYEAIDPAALPGAPRDSSHPTPPQRAEVVKVRLRQVLEKVDLFRLGLWFYQAEQYERAAAAFEEFLRFFPSREVYHNLACCHHRLALRACADWKEEADPLPFRLSLAVDPETRAGKIALRGGEGKEAEAIFREHLAKAVENYEKAIALDPSHVLSRVNFGCALLLADDPYKSVAVLREAVRLDPGAKEAHNNLGVAYFFAESPAKARESLRRARDLDPGYDAPAFNLGKIAWAEKNADEARKQWEAYLALDPPDARAEAVRKTLGLTERKGAAKPAGGKAEAVLGLEAGASRKEVPRDFGNVDSAFQAPLEEDPFKVETYSGGLVTVSQRGDVVLIVVPPAFPGKTEGGIAIGGPAAQVRAAYGPPGQVLELADGEAWVFKERGISFRVRDGKVVSWQIF